MSLRTMLGDELVSTTDASDDTPIEPFSGTVDELLSYHGFRRTGDQPST